MRFLTFSIAALCAALSFNSQADSSYFYVGAAVQQQDSRGATFTPDYNTELDVYSNAEVTKTVGDSGYRLFAGYAFNKYIAIEADYNDYAEQSFSLLGNEDDEYDINFSGMADPQSIGSQFVMNLPFSNNFSVRAKVGFIVWESEIDTVSIAEDESLPTLTTENDYGADVSTGLGFHYAVNKNIALIVDWDNRPVLGKNIETLGASLAFAF